MRHKGLIVIGALVAVPVLATLATWWAWEAGAFDAEALPGTVEVSVLYRGTDGRTIGFTLRCTLPRNDLVGYTRTVEGDTMVLRVTRRRLFVGRRRPKVLQVEELLPPGVDQVVLRASGSDTDLQIWPR